MPYKDKEKKRANARLHRRKHRAHRNAVANHRRAFMERVKRFVGCVDCPERDPCCLEFHHCFGSKDFDVSQGCQKSMVRIKNEIRKCVVLCANCHRKRHAKEKRLASLPKLTSPIVMRSISSQIPPFVLLTTVCRN
jgi:hypothetical protein